MVPRLQLPVSLNLFGELAQRLPRRGFLRAAVGLAVVAGGGAAGYRWWLGGTAARSPAPQAGQPVLPARPIPPPAPDYAARAWRHAKDRLQTAQQQSQQQIAVCLQAIPVFFEDAETHAAAFAEEALAFRSQWLLVWDTLPWTDNNHLQERLSQLFSDHFFSAAKFEAVLAGVTQAYGDELESIDSKLLVDLRCDVQDLPVNFPLTTRSLASLASELRVVEVAQSAVARSGRKEALLFVASEVAASVVVQIGARLAARLAARGAVSTATTAAGATAAPVTLGLSLVVAILVDVIVSYVWDWFADPRGNLAEELRQALRETCTALLDGVEGQPGLRAQFSAFAQEHHQHRIQVVRQALRLPKSAPDHSA